MSTNRILAAALAAAALAAAPAAQAQPADMHASVAQAQAKANAKANAKQDLRSADARDAAKHPRAYTPGAESAPLPGPPTWAVNPQPIAPAPVAEVSDGGDGVDTTTIGLGIAGGLLAVSGLAALTTRRSRRLHRAAGV